MRTSVLCLVGAAALLCAALPSHAEIYKWVDKDGSVHFQDTPPPAGSAATVVPEAPGAARPGSVAPAEGGAAAVPAAADNAAPAATPPRKKARLKQNPKVEIYGTSWCPYCRMARDYFRQRGIAFDDYDVEKDLDALRRKKEIDGDGGVPTTVIDGKVIRGFSVEEYEKALEEPNPEP